MNRRLFAWGVLLLLAGATLAQEAQPRLVIDGSGRLRLSDLPPVLDDKDVKRHLKSGLTTSLVFEARLQGPMKDGAARVDVRFELWDEVYLVTVIDGEGRLEKSQHGTLEALSEWWSDVEIVLSMPAAEAGRFGFQAKVSLAVVPFSQTELDDTQRWLTESMAQAQGGSRAGGEGGASRAVGALIATSMQRRAVRSMTWSLPIARRDKP